MRHFIQIGGVIIIRLLAIIPYIVIRMEEVIRLPGIRHFLIMKKEVITPPLDKVLLMKIRVVVVTHLLAQMLQEVIQQEVIILLLATGQTIITRRAQITQSSVIRLETELQALVFQEIYFLVTKPDSLKPVITNYTSKTPIRLPH